MTNERKTILHVIDTTGPGGAETVFIQLARLCVAAGYRVVVVIRGTGWVYEKLTAAGLDVRIVPCKGSFNFEYLRALIRIIKVENVGLIQSHLLGSNVYCSLAGLLTGQPVISTFHGHVDINPQERLKWLKFLVIFIGSRSVVAVTAPLAADIGKIGKGLLRRKTRVIANGISLSGFESTLKTRSFGRGSLRLCCLGNVRVAKNYLLALETVKCLLDDAFDVVLKIAGDDSNELARKLKVQVKDLGLTGRVEFVGFVNDVPEFLDQHDVFLMTSTSEGHPLALTQALAAGLPIVTTPSGVESVMDNTILYVSDDHSSQRLCDLIKKVCDEPIDDIQSRIEAGRRIAFNEFSNEAMFRRYLEVYSLD